MIEKNRRDRSLVAVTFRVPSEAGARSATVVGEFNEWSTTATPMAEHDYGFSVVVDLQSGRQYRFRYLLDGERWENDWAADAYVPNEYAAMIPWSISHTSVSRTRRPLLLAEEATETLLPLAEKCGVTVETSGAMTSTVGSQPLLQQNMEILCAECGCLVERGSVITRCGRPDCCCGHLPAADAHTTDDVATYVRSRRRTGVMGQVAVHAHS